MRVKGWARVLRLRVRLRVRLAECAWSHARAVAAPAAVPPQVRAVTASRSRANDEGSGAARSRTTDVTYTDKLSARSQPGAPQQESSAPGERYGSHQSAGSALWAPGSTSCTMARPSTSAVLLPSLPPAPSSRLSITKVWAAVRRRLRTVPRHVTGLPALAPTGNSSRSLGTSVAVSSTGGSSSTGIRAAPKNRAR